MKNKLLLIPFILLFLILELIFWLYKDSLDFGFSFIVYYIVMPISVFTESIIYSQSIKSNKKYFIAPIFGLIIMLFEYTTYSLANMISFNKINVPDLSLFLIYTFISLLGCLFVKKQEK